MAEVGLQGNFRSPIGARLDGVEAEFKRLEAENAQLREERDAAREAWRPFLEEIEDLRARVLAVIPKDKRLPSARTRLREISDADVDDWIIRNKEGASVHAIATGAGVSFETVRIKMIRAGHNPVMHQNEQKVAHRLAPTATGKGAKAKSERVPRCRECDLPMDSPALTNSNVPPPVDGVCGLCQFIARDLAEKREKAA